MNIQVNGSFAFDENGWFWVTYDGWFWFLVSNQRWFTRDLLDGIRHHGCD